MKFDSSVVKRVSNDVKDTNTTLLSSFSLGIFYSPIYPVGILQSISLGRTGWNDDLGKFERHQGDIINYKY